MQKLASPKLFALLVGIDSYLPPITPLSGCVNDVYKLKQYFEREDKHFEPSVRTLTNAQATKENVVGQFEEHLSKAKKEDSILFYYSGHGTQEDANAVFWPGESDKKLETLVCYDSVQQANGITKINLLADKELRFLLGKLAKTGAHIVTIFDCCHSGGNTRNGNFNTEVLHSNNTADIRARRLSMAFPERDWADFIFGTTISPQDIKMKGISSCLPEGEHLQIAACQDDESAYEVRGEGVFTKNLVEILQRCNGSISYHRLQGIIQAYLRHQFNQTPKIYCTGNRAALFSNFLNNSSQEERLKGSVSYNDSLGWILDMGSLQGAVSGNELRLLNEATNELHSAIIDTVNVSYSTVRFLMPDAAAPAKDAIFTSEIDSFFTNALHIFIDPGVAQKIEHTSLVEKITEASTLHLIEEINQADYCLTQLDAELILSYPGKSNIPLVPKIELSSFGESQANTIFYYLNHLSKFAFVKYVHNPGAFLISPKHIDIDVYVDDDLQKSTRITNDTLLLNYTKIGSEWKGAVKIKLRNNSNKKLYCALCYLSLNFGVYTNMIKEGVVGLAARQEAWAWEGNAIQLKLEPEISAFEYPESISYLKLFISTEDFTQQLNTLALEDLPGPLFAERGHKGLQISKEPEVIHDWTTRLITVRIPNPTLDHISN